LDRIKKFNHTTFASLQNRNYRLYFIGQTISFSGTWMQTIALGLLVLKLTGSGTTLGIVMGLQFLPILFIGPFAGVIIDRFPKSKILFFTQTLAGLLALSLGLLVIFNIIQIWMIYLFALGLGTITAFDNPTRHTFLMELVGKGLLRNATVLNATMVSLARIIGPALAGILAVTVGLGPCFLINASTYIAVILTLFLIDKKQLSTTPKPEQEKNQLREGFRYIRSNPVLANTLLMACIVGTLTYNFSIILAVLAEFTFHSPAGYAVLTIAMSAGAVFGGLFSASRGKTSMKLLTITAVFFGTSLIAASLMPTITTVAILMVAVGAFSINFTSMATTILQLEAAPHMRGRVMSLWTMAFLGSTPIGAPIIGWVSEHMGARWGLAIGGLAALTAAAIGAAYLARRVSKVSASNAAAAGVSKVSASNAAAAGVSGAKVPVTNNPITQSLK
jgi:MFS family permease